MAQTVLTIKTPAYTPAVPSLLSVPSSPHSPLSPLTPKLPHPMPTLPKYAERNASILKNYPVPATPLPWRWQCHECMACFNLGTTRRCLHDGHVFCTGYTPVSICKPKPPSKHSARKRKRHSTRTCASEFDYEGWRTYGTWRRAIEAAAEAAVTADNPRSITPPTSPGSGSYDYYEDNSPVLTPTATHASSAISSSSAGSITKKHCTRLCDYPSQCRWGTCFTLPSPPLTPAPSAPSNPCSPDSRNDTLADKAKPRSSGPVASDVYLTLSAGEEEEEDTTSPEAVMLAKERKEREGTQVETLQQKKVPTSFEEILGLPVTDGSGQVDWDADTLYDFLEDQVGEDDDEAEEEADENEKQGESPLHYKRSYEVEENQGEGKDKGSGKSSMDRIRDWLGGSGSH